MDTIKNVGRTVNPFLTAPSSIRMTQIQPISTPQAVTGPTLDLSLSHQLTETSHFHLI